jgi:glutamate-1-semialdehyde aminotransferase
MKNWRTTLAGVIGAAVTVALPMVQGGTLDSKTLAYAAGLAAVSWLAKDAGQTGTDK